MITKTIPLLVPFKTLLEVNLAVSDITATNRLLKRKYYANNIVYHSGTCLLLIVFSSVIIATNTLIINTNN